MSNITSEQLLLYAVTDRSWLNGRSLPEDVEKTLRGGATFVQLREKDSTFSGIREEALALKALCARYQVPFVIDDDVALANEVGADGVHVGQSDMACAKAREALGPDAIIGVSAQTVAQARAAEAAGADYLGVGAVFPTGSKDDAVEVSHEVVREICEAVSIPVVAIGGISRDNVGSLSGLGLSGIAVISALFAQEDLEAAAKDLRDRMKAMVEA